MYYNKINNIIGTVSDDSIFTTLDHDDTKSPRFLITAPVLSTHYISIYFTLFASYRMMHGAVNPRPSFSNPFRVAIRTTRDASTGPKSKSHSENTEFTPAKMSPIPPHLFMPPSVLTTNE